MNFVVAVLSSVVGGVVLLACVSLVSERARWVVTAALGRLVDMDVEYVFRSPRAAADDVSLELGKARFVHVLTGRGNEFQREAFAPVLGKEKPRAEVKILLPCTEHGGGPVDWVEDREVELSAFDAAYGHGTLRSQIRSNATFLNALPAPLEVRRYDYPHIGRILVTDRCAYLTPYAEDKHGRDSKVIKYRRSGEMYDFLDRIFSKVWIGSHPEAPATEPGSVPPAR